jgi:hypothetical protein
MLIFLKKISCVAFRVSLSLFLVTLFIYPGGVVLINFIKEGYSDYWLPFLYPAMFFGVCSCLFYILRRRK